jgi:transcriptional regulator with XRE-family HTH domain
VPENRQRNDVGRLVREARQRSGISQRSLARRAGTSQAAISRIERGLEQPTFERLEQILAGLGWRPALSLQPIAEHDEQPRRLLASAHDTPKEHLERGLSLSRFAASLDKAAAAARG